MEQNEEIKLKFEIKLKKAGNDTGLFYLLKTSIFRI